MGRTKENRKKDTELFDQWPLFWSWKVFGLNLISPYESKMSSMTQARMEVEQLRREAAIKRIPVSQVVEDIKKFIMDHQQSDCLVEGFGRQSLNPFREKTW